MFRIHASHRRLATSLVGLTDAQLRQPSLLPDWTVGHVLAHIALNAEAFVSVAGDLAEGRFGVMYPGGVERRNADIEKFAVASAHDLCAHIDRACLQFESVWPTLSDEMLQGDFGISVGSPAGKGFDVPLRRLREVEVHHADAGLLTFAYSDWSDSYVDSDLPVQMKTVAERLGRSIAFVDENGITYLCGEDAMDSEPIATSRRNLLAWSFNRANPPELPSILGWQR